VNGKLLRAEIVTVGFALVLLIKRKEKLECFCERFMRGKETRLH